MPTSHEIKQGEIYTCQICGLSLQVIKESNRFGKSLDDIEATDAYCATCGGQFLFSICCCGTHLKKDSSASTAKQRG